MKKTDMKFINDNKQAAATIITGILLITGAVMDIIDYDYAYIFFAAGALIAIIQSFTFAYKNRSTDIRISRLHRINFLASLTLGIGAYMMYINSNSWVAMLILYVLITLFLAIRWKE